MYNSCFTVSIEGYAQTGTITRLAQLGFVQYVATGTHTTISKSDNKTQSLNPLAEDWWQIISGTKNIYECIQMLNFSVCKALHTYCQ